MKIQFNPKDFLRKLQMAQKAVLGRHITPILENVKIVADKKSGVFLMATNSDVGIRIRVDCTIHKSGAAILPVERLVKILKLTKEESVMLKRSETGIVLYDESKHTELQMGCDPKEFPDIAAFPKSQYCEIPVGLLQETLRRTAFAVDKNSVRHALGGVCFESNGGLLDVVASDGRRMAWQQLEGVSPLIGRSIVPVTTLTLLEKILKDKSVDKHDGAKMAFQKDGVMFQCGDVTLFSRLVDGEFPDWKTKVPNKRKMPHATVRCGDLFSAIRRATVCTTLGKPAVRLVLDGGVLAVESRFVETVYGNPVENGETEREEFEESGTARITIPVSFSGHAEFAVCPKEIIDFLSAFNSATKLSVYLPADGKKQAMIIPEEGYTYVVLPAENWDYEEPETVTGVEVDGQNLPEEESMKKPEEVPPCPVDETETRILQLLSENEQLHARAEHYKALLVRAMRVIAKAKEKDRCVAVA